MKMGLKSRLFCSHLFAMVLGFLISRIITFYLFGSYVQQINSETDSIHSARILILNEFKMVWLQSTVWAAITSGLVAIAWSSWVAKHLTQTLVNMENITCGFASGDLSKRIPSSDIPEFNRLARSFNRMATCLEDVEQRRRQLMSDLTHELRTPLTIIRGYLEAWALGTLEPSVEIYQLLIREAKRLERLIKDAQDLSKSEAGHLSLTQQAVDLQPLLVSLVQRFSSQLLDDGPVMCLDCPSNLSFAFADVAFTEQVLVNLLGNAILHTHMGRITVRAWNDNQQIWIAVIDTGPGIAAKDLPHVFERFWRAEQTRTQYAGGTGLGLAIARRLVELQGGTIEVESQLGQGSTFRFSLPIAT